jgi:fructan beta-fructosidase
MIMGRGIQRFHCLCCTLALLGSAVASVEADYLFSESFTTGLSNEWQTTQGKWTSDETGLSNSKKGENRIFIVIPKLDSFRIDLTASLEQGKGWGIWFSSSLDEKYRVSGYNFQYDPGYGSGAYLLRRWQKNRESVIAAEMEELDFGTFHDFNLVVSPTSFQAFQDGELVLSYAGKLDTSNSTLGLRTWSNSQATFQDLTIGAGSFTAAPEPASLLMLTGAGIALVGIRRRHPVALATAQ